MDPTGGLGFVLPSSIAGGVALLITAILALYISLTFNGPVCNIQEFYVPALDLTAPPEYPLNSTNPCIFFDVSLTNVVSMRSLTYGNVTLTFYYGSGHKAVGSYVISGFEQGRLKTAQRRDVVETRGMPWEDAVKAVSGGSTAAFRVELAARPRFKFIGFHSKEKKVDIAADVDVDGTGMKTVKDDVRLNSAAIKRSIHFILFISVVVATYLVF